ncbi:polysaccharide biosynthesis tyrosine autokinase [Acidipropionibacterium virtanenii]|uniref:Tyrosine-protein kinase YwqD n=1 Tax=Acidipropionibacterium virtanenii TaxID=2057246 RepID=A0A344UXJ0_9ACTN|nr:polysaccharide biosynthesis tyrosine autokinase [Acidipropionibacterium virtanenii]AXE39988.1 Tyrosine-protein kinase YwqD [Acidipropionibacterium virtanenii]
MRHYWISAVVLALISTVVVGFVHYSTSKPTYTSNADVVFTSRAFESFRDPDSAASYTTSLVQTYSNYLQSPSVLGPIAHSIDPAMNASNLKQGIEFTPGPMLLQLSYESGSKAQGDKVMKALTDEVRRAVGQTPTTSDKTPVIEIARTSVSTTQVAGTTASLTRSGAIGLLIGLVIGLVYLFLRALLDTRVRSVDAVMEVTDSSVLGALPKAVGVGTDVTVLARNLRFIAPRDGARTVLLASSVPGEGAGEVALRAADELAGTGDRVLLIDADLRGHQATTAAGASGEGLADVLAGRAEASDVIVTRETSRHEGAALLPAGSAVGNPAELLAGEKPAATLAALAGDYDEVILAGAPILSGSDSLLIAPLVAATVPVIGLGRVNRSDLVECLELLDAGDATLGGVVLTGVTRPTSGKDPYSPLATAAQH